MRYQPAPVLIFKETYESIISTKHQPFKATLESIALQIYPHIDTYSTKLLALNSMFKTEWSEDQSSALKLCYDSKTKPLSELKDKLWKHLRDHHEVNLQICPYCLLNPPSTWDHYLPQSIYPEFSVLPINLVYVCADCNKIKLNDNHSYHLDYIHPYFYPTGDVTILQCSINVNQSGKLVINFYSAHQDANFSKLVDIGTKHVRNLDLERLYQTDSGSLISTFIAEIRRDFPSGITKDKIKSIIENKFQMVEVNLGPNAWEARMWAALYHFDEFTDYVNVEIQKLQRPLRVGIDTLIPPP